MNRLDCELAAKIRSASVVTLTQAVCELVENSIDALATTITVRLNWRHLSVFILDDGVGMDKSLLQSLGRHKTTKIAQYLDLNQCNTYGFKGEGLFNLGQLGKLRIVSKVIGQAAASATDGVISDFNFEDTQQNPKNLNWFHIPEFDHGSAVIVYDLFQEVPVRKQHAQQQGKSRFLNELKNRLVTLNLPTIRVYLDDQLVIKFDKGCNVMNSIFDMNLTFSRVRMQASKYSIVGIVSSESRKGKQFLLLNNRVYHLDLKFKNAPAYLIRIKCDIPPNELFQDSDKSIWTSIHEELVKPILARLFDLLLCASVTRRSPRKHNNGPKVIKPRAPVKTILDQYRDKNLDTGYKDSIQVLQSTNQLTKSDLINLEVISQVDNKFILCKTKNCLYVIDQHAADERIRVEKIIRTVIESPCMVSINKTLQLDAESIEQLNYYKDYFKPLITIEHNTVTAVVDLIQFEENLEQNLLQHLSHVKQSEKFKITSNWYTSVANIPTFILNEINLKACRQAIMFGDKLTKLQTARLVNDLSACQLPFRCAHGRPSIIPIVKI